MEDEEVSFHIELEKCYEEVRSAIERLTDDSENDGYIHKIKDTIQKWVGLEEAMDNDPIASLQLSVSYRIGDKIDAKIFWKSSERYDKLLEDFFNRNGAITRGEKGVAGRAKTINGGEVFEDKKVYYKSYNNIDTNKESNFEKWNEFISDRNFGKYSIWLNVKPQRYKPYFGDDEYYRIDFFIVLNKDISKLWSENQKRCVITNILYKFGISEGITEAVHELHKIIRGRALKTAITNVFARNFAHNIGSHVAINSSNQEIRRRIDDLYDDDSNSGSQQISESQQARDWLDYITRRLSQYQIHRNEYLADFLNQSLVPMRLYRDLVLDFAENAILMDNLAKSEGISFERQEDGCVRNRLRIRTFIEGKQIQCHYPSAKSSDACGEDVVYPDHFPYLVQGTENGNGIDEAYNDKEIGWVGTGEEGEPDVEVSISNPHAFYSILENFIRNSAKHCEDTLRGDGGPDDLKVYLSLQENDESYSIAIHDNVSVVDLEKALRFQKNAIEGSLLGDDLEPTRENSGIADMKVNAFLLSMPSDGLSDDALKKRMEIVVCAEDCEDPSEREFKGLREFRSEDDEAKREVDDASRPISDLKEDIGERVFFGYQFKLLKPKKVCWVGTRDTELEASTGKLRREGITFHESPSAYFEASRERSLASYDFAVLREEAVRKWLDEGEDGEVQAQLDKLLLALPCRVLLVTENEEATRPEVLAEAIDQRRLVTVQGEEALLAHDDDEEIAERLLRQCWHAWLSRWNVESDSDKKAKAYLYAFEDTVERWAGDEEDPPHPFNKNVGPVDLTLVAREKVEKEESEERVLEDDPPAEEGRLVIYERHGGFLDAFGPETYRGEVAPRLRDSEFTNTFDKNSADFARINYPPQDADQREFLTYKLVEAGLLRVLIIDERVVGLSEDDLHNSLRYVLEEEADRGYKVPKDKEKFWYQSSVANVFLVTNIVDEGTGGELSVGGEDLSKRLTLNLRQGEGASVAHHDCCENGSIGSEPFDVAVLHRTLFLKMRDLIKKDSESEEAAAKRLVGQLRQLVPFLVIDSGGGEPHGIKRSIPYRFVSYSKLSRCFTSSGGEHVIAKAKLANYLLTLRRNASFN